MQEKICVAGLNVAINLKYNKTKNQIQKYVKDFEKQNLKIQISDEEFLNIKNELNYLSDEDIEYIYTGIAFYEALLNFNGFMLHSSGVVVDGYAYLFSADSGVGKSTHTDLYLKHFGADKAKIINDDKPAIKIEEDGIYVYGTPWSGKTDKNLNIKAKLGAIIFLERSENNWIEEISNQEAIPLILQQTIRPKDKNLILKLLDMLDLLLKNVKVYKLGCNISNEAVQTSYNKIKREV